MPIERLQAEVAVGNIVNVPCVVTAITGGTQPTVTLETINRGFNGLNDVVGPLDTIQVQLKQ